MIGYKKHEHKITFSVDVFSEVALYIVNSWVSVNVFCEGAIYMANFSTSPSVFFEGSIFVIAY